MTLIRFSSHKQTIAEFRAESMQFAQEQGGLLLTAEGEMQFQDTSLLAEMVNSHASFHVTILKDGDTVIDQPFQVTFFTVEAQELVVLLR